MRFLVGVFSELSHWRSLFLLVVDFVLIGEQVVFVEGYSATPLGDVVAGDEYVVEIVAVGS